MGTVRKIEGFGPIQRRGKMKLWENPDNSVTEKFGTLSMSRVFVRYFRFFEQAYFCYLPLIAPVPHIILSGKNPDIMVSIDLNILVTREF